MKLIVGIILGLLPFVSSAQWTDVSLPNSTEVLNLISFSSANHGVVAPSYDNQYFRTLDGGATWTDHVIDSIRDMRQIQFVDEMTGFALGTEVSGFANSFIKTTDGGATWTVLPALATNNMSYFAFTDPLNGYIIADYGATSAVLSTNDGGSSWNINQLAGIVYASDANIISSDTIIFAGWDGTFNYSGVLLSTYDGGATWNYDVNTITYSQIVAISFLTATHGYRLHTSIGGGDYVSETSDGGNTWSGLFAVSAFENLTDIYFGAPNDGYICYSNGHIIAIDTAGNTSNSLNLLGSQIVMNKMDGVDNTLYAIGTEGAVFKKALSTGIESVVATDHLTAYPNPAQAELTVEIPAQGTLELHSTDGRLLQSEAVQVGKLTMDLSSFASGTYILSFRNSKMRIHSVILHQ